MTRLMLATLIAGVLVGGCSKGPARKETYRVIGKITVDGKPVENLAVRCYNTSGLDKESPTVSSAFTQEDGSFEIGTYEQGDGVPEGEYVLTFEWGEMNMLSMSYGGDKFEGKYSDKSKSEVKFKAGPEASEDGGPIDLGTIELTTK